MCWVTGGNILYHCCNPTLPCMHRLASMEVERLLAFQGTFTPRCEWWPCVVNLTRFTGALYMLVGSAPLTPAEPAPPGLGGLLLVLAGLVPTWVALMLPQYVAL